MLETHPRQMSRAFGMGRAAEVRLVELPERFVSGAEDEAASVHDQDAGRQTKNLDQISAPFRRDSRFLDRPEVSRHRLWLK